MDKSSSSPFIHPSKDFQAHANVSSIEAYQALCHQASSHSDLFWMTLARKELVWHTLFTKGLDSSRAPFYTWFADGTLNASYNCLDIHLQNGWGQKVALIFEADDGTSYSITYQALHQRVSQFANGLRTLGVGVGDRVVIYMPMSIEGIVAMQACARIGAIHSVVFGGFSAKSLQERVIDAGATTIITADYQMRGGKALPLKAIVDEALAMGQCEQVAQVIVYQRTGGEINWQTEQNGPKNIWLHELVNNQSDQCEPAWVGAEHPLFLLYTSGSTGKPKGVQHSSGGYLLWAKQSTQWVFDIKPQDVFWCTADIGWITGHTYVVYGPLACGATQVIFEGIPTYPDAARFWRTIEKHRVSIFYTAPTAIRSLIKASEEHPSTHPKHANLSSLRLLGSVGEPINPAAWEWYHEYVGQKKCPIVDTFWQTETGGIMIAPLPGATPLLPGSCTLPLPGVAAAIVDETGQAVPDGQKGQLVFKSPWPAMIRTIWNDPERFQKTYFPAHLQGAYLVGDGAIRDPHTDYFTIIGRLDDVLNVSGHRLGTAEIESALVAHPWVAEAAVVGKPHDVMGEAICAFVVLKQSCLTKDAEDTFMQDLKQWVSKEIGPIAKPQEIHFVDNLPKTRSGKIMRRLLRSVAKKEKVTQDTSTLDNPGILKQLTEAL